VVYSDFYQSLSLISISESPSTYWISKSLLALSSIAGGWDALIDGWESLQEKRIDVHTLMIVVAVGSWIIGHAEEGALLLFLFLPQERLNITLCFVPEERLMPFSDRAPSKPA
jgi:cation transport ATPase